MNRLSNVGKAVLVLVLCMTVLLAGCSTAWIGQAEEIVAALIPAAGNVLTLVAALQGKTVSASDMQMVQTATTQASADLQLVQSLIAAYQKADAAAQPGILNQIEAAINGVQANLQGLLPALHIKDAATQAKITAVIGLTLSEVQSLTAILPIVKAQTASGPAAAMARMTMAAPVAARARAPLSASEFVSSYNAMLTAKTGNADVDRATAGLKIHAHGKMVRVVSAGVVQ